jgi:hypothetical protein
MTDQDPADHRDAEVVPLRAMLAAEIEAAPSGPATYADVTAPGERKPILPAWLRGRDAMRHHAARAAGYGWHAARFHALRSPVYLILTAWWAAAGIVSLAVRWARWMLFPVPLEVYTDAIADGHRHWHRAHQVHENATKDRAIISVCVLAAAVLAGGDAAPPAAVVGVAAGGRRRGGAAGPLRPRHAAHRLTRARPRRLRGADGDGHQPGHGRPRDRRDQRLAEGTRDGLYPRADPPGRPRLPRGDRPAFRCDRDAGHRAPGPARLRAAPPAGRGVAGTGGQRARGSAGAVGRPGGRVEGEGAAVAAAEGRPGGCVQAVPVGRQPPGAEGGRAHGLSQLAHWLGAAAGEDWCRPCPGLRCCARPAGRDVGTRTKGDR